MCSVTTVTKLITVGGTAQNKELIIKRFEKMQSDALRSPAKLPTSLRTQSLTSVHRLSVRNYYYYAPSDKDQPTRK
jgi:hypothetical protein